MTDCERFAEALSALLDGELDGEAEAAARAHMESCPDCRAMYEAFAAVGAAVRGQDVPDSLHAGIMEKIRAAEKAGRTQKTIVRLRPVLAAAACLVVLVGTVFALKNTFRMGSSTPAAGAPMAKEAVAPSVYTSGGSAAAADALPAEGAPESWLTESKAADAVTAEAPMALAPPPAVGAAATTTDAAKNETAEGRTFTLRLTARTDEGFTGILTDETDSGTLGDRSDVTVLWDGDSEALEPGMLVIVTVSAAEQPETGTFRALHVEPAEQP